MDERGRLRRKAWIAGIACAFVIVIAVVGFSIMGNPFDHSRFSADAWRTADAKSRAPMARDAIRHHLVAGLRADQVLSLIGKPDAVLRGSDAGGHKLAGVKTYSYHLGCWSGYGFDDAFLYVHFDAAGTVISAEVNGY